MIGHLKGVVAHKGLDHVVLDVGGVGYVVHAPEGVLAALPGLGEAAMLYTEMLVREDAMQLYGFTSPQEREWHRLLISVQGIGAKASMAILGVLGADGVARAVALSDWHSIAKAKGVGPKTAQRVTNELKDKAPSMMALGDAPVVETAVPLASGGAQAEALSALTNLGYAGPDAAAAVAEASSAEDSTESIIRAALRLLAPKG